jgi:hypothetical protein
MQVRYITLELKNLQRPTITKFVTATDITMNVCTSLFYFILLYVCFITGL